MSDPRYAIYFVPAEDSALHRLGSLILGYDCYSGCEVSFPPDIPVAQAEWRKLVAAPGTYGFHATLKAPFLLAAGARRADLDAAFHAHANSMTAAVEFEPAVRLLESFIAVVSAGKAESLNDLAAQCVIALDRFRAPLTAEDRARRLKPGLTGQQIENLDRWGYPYVFEDFRFHMTMTDAVDASGVDSALGYLRELFTREHGEGPIRIDRLALVEQEKPGARFRVISQASIGEN